MCCMRDRLHDRVRLQHTHTYEHAQDYVYAACMRLLCDHRASRWHQHHTHSYALRPDATIDMVEPIPTHRRDVLQQLSEYVQGANTHTSFCGV